MSLRRWWERLLYGRAKLPIPHGPGSTRYEWQCASCGTWYRWSVPVCPKDGAGRPRQVAADDAPHIPDDGP